MRESFRTCGSKLPGGSCLIIVGTEGADHLVANQLIARIGPAGRQSLESPSQCQSNGGPTAGVVKGP